MLASDTNTRVVIQKLESDLDVYKRAYAGLDAERQRTERLKQEADKQREDLENQLKGNRVIVLIDGDGAIFNPQLVAQGQAGGHIAAQKLSDSIISHLTTNYGSNPYQLRVYIFLNKRGLSETLARVGLMPGRHKFEDFIAGFNQAAERFIMLDVGSAKEAADAKIKGCHDNGYATTLRSQITAGFKQKLILLRSYSDMAAGIDELDLPSFSIPDLFIAQKLASNPSPVHNPSQPAPTSTASPVPSPRSVVQDLGVKPVAQPGLEVLPFNSVERLEVGTPKERPAPLTYSSAVQATSKRAATPELDSSGSTISSDDSEDSLPKLRPSLAGVRSRRLTPNLPLSKHNPPPCTLFYLSNCKHGSECKYAHDYILQPEHFQEIRVNAKKSPCPSRNKGELCVWGDDCCYGHFCAQTRKCHFFKQNRCKFVGADMHKEPKD
ncbi:hypothetical protein CPB83DRAFT_803828 [Crepidotus variabilis]|uniref:C3H1-type domain-containing protein n=1 Tax=Crepidotus variabilis TaxID=179855 RepID=A0A9P6EQE9_9AGAR|nr:hypothetical protein CPB83DRAFT_803828 [Crepidotus variabilis]